jgi:sulfur-carrier protein
MEITVRLMAGLRDLLPKGPRDSLSVVNADRGTTIGQFMTELGLPGDIEVVVIVNGVYVREDHLLQDGDRVDIFPPMAGG